jgi:hypothetical protein
MLQLLEHLVEQIAVQPEGRSGWFVSPEGEYFCAEELVALRQDQRTKESRLCILVEPGLLFLDLTGLFDLDRLPDFYVLPASDLGAEVLEQARKVSELARKGDDLQVGYLDAVQQESFARRRLRGGFTMRQMGEAVRRGAEALALHTSEERAAREQLAALLGRFAQVDHVTPR